MRFVAGAGAAVGVLWHTYWALVVMGLTVGLTELLMAWLLITLIVFLKAVFLMTSVLGLTGLWLAILADTGATVLVTLNALRLLRFNPEREG